MANPALQTPVRQTHPCTVCDTAARLDDVIGDVHLYRCPACTHRLTDVDALGEEPKYDKEWVAEHENWWANPNTKLFDLVADTVLADTPQASVIDVGCGHGELLEHLRKRSPKSTLTGFDLALEPQIDDVETILGDFATYDFGGRSWDAATSMATIEHVADVRAFVHGLKEIVRPGGLCVVMTLDDHSVLYGVGRTLKRLGYREAYERLYDRHHLNHFSARSLRLLFEREGFVVEKVHHHNIPMASVDMPNETWLKKLGVLTTFTLGKLMRRTYLQTLVARRPASDTPS